MINPSKTDEFFEAMAAISSEIQELRHHREQLDSRVSQFETVLRLLIIRGGQLAWTAEELKAAQADGRAVALGALDCDLWVVNQPERDAPDTDCGGTPQPRDSH